MAMELLTQAISGYGNAARTRTGFYRLLSIAFRYPEPEIVAALGNEETQNLVDEVKEVFSVMPSVAGLMDSFREEIRTLRDHSGLQVEYTRLFIGPFHLPAPPYESLYWVESQGMVMGEPTLAVRAMYRGEGLDLSGSVHDLPDHIIAELEFMSYLAGQEALRWEREPEGVRSCLMKQDAFLSAHLAKWTPLFTRAVVRETNEEFYRLLARLLAGFIPLDHDYVRALTTSPDLPGWGNNGASE